MEGKLTIEELLATLVTKDPMTKGTKDADTFMLQNTLLTWEKIGEGTIFKSLPGKKHADKEKFLKQWIEDNPYHNI